MASSSSSSSLPSSYTVTADNINPHVRDTSYEVRGEIYLAAVKRAAEGKQVLYTNIGNPHSLGQKPLTFTRQVLALALTPFLLDHPEVERLFPSDAIARARAYHTAFKGGIGAYTDSKGDLSVRKEIARFIETRNHVTCDPENIFMGNGASEVVRLWLQMLLFSKSDGMLVSIPQYPLYSAGISLNGGTLIPYYLQEEDNWSLDIGALQRSVDESRAKGITVKAMAYINPGNPTGQCLSESNLRDIIAFCHRNKLVLCADEVYQENIYSSTPFMSARAVLNKMPEPIRSSTELVSFHSISKGLSGECGLRGGYMELHNIDPGTTLLPACKSLLLSQS